MPSRRLTDRIRELCDKVVTTAESKQFALAMEQLQYALREHTNRLRTLAANLAESPQRRGSDPAHDEAGLVKCTTCGLLIALEIAKVDEDGHPVHEGCYVAKLRTAKSRSSATAHESALSIPHSV